MEQHDINNNVGISECQVCGNIVTVYQFNNGRCEKCNWEQGGDSLDFPNNVRYPNRVSSNSALRRYRQNKPLIPTFEDFIEMFQYYGEVEFWYANKNYGVTACDGKIIEFFEDGNADGIQKFASIEEFAQKASIDGHLLCKIWQNVYKAAYMGCIEDY